LFGSKLKRKKCIFLSFSLFSFFLKIYKWKWTEEIEVLDTKPREKKKKSERGCEETLDRLESNQHRFVP